MNVLNYKLSGCAIAVAALLSACGGGGTTPDTTPPTVAITDNVAEATTSGDVTFTFSFNEAVTGFTKEDISVTTGTVGEFTMAPNGLSATLVVTPPSTGTGNIEVSVAAGTFTDAANNANTAGASASQAYGTPAPAAFLSFDEAESKIIGDIGRYGGALPDVVTGPTGGNAKALKITKPIGSEIWGGIYFSVPKIPFTSSQKAITARVYSSVADAEIMLKVEGGEGFVEVPGTKVERAGEWTTVTWNFSEANLAANYTVLAIGPDVDRESDGATYYIDDIKIVDTPVTPTPATGLTAPTVPSANVLSVFSDTYTPITGVNTNPNWGQSTTVSSVTYGSNNVLKMMNLNYQGIDWASNPIDLSTYTHLHIDLWSSNATSVDVFIIGSSQESSVNVPLTSESWTSIDIPLSSFSLPANKSSITQLKLVGNPTGKTIYVDNIYFKK